MLSADELTAIQAAASASFDQPCVVKRATDTQDTTGYTTHPWTTVTTTTARMAVPTGSYMQMIADKLSDLKTWLVSLPVGTSVQQNDLLIVGGQTLTVQTVFAPQSYQASVRLLASEVV